MSTPAQDDNKAPKKPGLARRLVMGVGRIVAYKPTVGLEIRDAFKRVHEDQKLPYRPIDYRAMIAAKQVTLEDLRARHNMLQWNARVTPVFFIAAFLLLIFYVDSFLMGITLVSIMGISASFQLLWSLRTWQLRRLHNATLSQFFDALGADFSLILPIHHFPDKV